VAFIIEHCRQLTGFGDPAQGRKTRGVKSRAAGGFRHLAVARLDR